MCFLNWSFHHQHDVIPARDRQIVDCQVMPWWVLSVPQENPTEHWGATTDTILPMVGRKQSNQIPDGRPRRKHKRRRSDWNIRMQSYVWKSESFWAALPRRFPPALLCQSAKIRRIYQNSENHSSTWLSHNWCCRALPRYFVLKRSSVYGCSQKDPTVPDNQTKQSIEESEEAQANSWSKTFRVGKNSQGLLHLGVRCSAWLGPKG